MSTLNLQVEASTDDCRRRVTPSDFSLTNTQNYCGDYDGANYDYGAGTRFNSVTIGQGDTIDAAVMQFRASTAWPTIPTTNINGEDADDAATFVDAADFDGRDRTAASVPWTPAAWVPDTWYTSSEIKTVIQEIVDRGGWESGNDLVLFWYHQTGGQGLGLLVAADSFDGAEADAPKLDIDYTAAGGPVVVDAVPATSPAAALVPTVTTQRSVVVSAVVAITTAAALLASVAIGKVVAAEPATAPTSALLPTITAQKNVSVSAEPAAADALALLPTIVTAKDVVVDGEVAEVTAEVPLPTITGQKNVAVAGEVATSPAAALLPTVEVGEAVAAEVAITTAEALLPVVRISKVVLAEVAEAPAATPLPTITAQQQVTISAEVAEAPAEALLPEVLIGGDALVDALPATADAAAPLAAIKTGCTLSPLPAGTTAEVVLSYGFVRKQRVDFRRQPDQ